MKSVSRQLVALSLLITTSCLEQLDIENPNNPSFNSIENEEGLMKFAMGGIYNMQTKYSGSFFLWHTVAGYHELMGDAIGTDDGSVRLNQIGCPDLVTLDNGTTVPSPFSPSTQRGFIRLINIATQGGSNPLYYEWALMYSLNNSANIILSLVDIVDFSGDDTDTKIKVLKAWALFWKGYAYSRIGSLYYAGIINNDPLASNNEYVSKDEVIDEAGLNFTLAYDILSTLTPNETYLATLKKLIPSFSSEFDGIPTPDMWMRQINTMRARNVLVNNTVDEMSAAQWNSILTLTEAGLSDIDKVFTLRSNATGDLMSANGGNVAAKTAGNRTFQVSERLIQDFRPGDKRRANNFRQTAPFIGRTDRGNSFNTRWQSIDGGNKMPGVDVLVNRTVGAYILYIAAFYVENELMKAEANIYLNKVDAGLAIVDKIRARQGAGLPPISGTGLSQAAAISELFSERRVALAFRGFSFYDARRYNKINTDRKGAVVIDKDGVLNTNATIRYNFMDYWDVPDNELAFNPPSPGSAPVKNPN